MKLIEVPDNSITHQIAATGNCVQISDWLDGRPLPAIVISRPAMARVLAAIVAVMNEGEE